MDVQENMISGKQSSVKVGLKADKEHQLSNIWNNWVMEPQREKAILKSQFLVKLTDWNIDDQTNTQIPTATN